MKCRNCRYLYKDWCAHKLDSPDPDLDRECKDYMRATHADRIRAMDDEQLAKLFYSVYKRSCIDFVNQSGIKAEIKFDNSEGSEAVFLKYLQQPAEEDTYG